MLGHPASDPLADDTARLVEFARACKAATRIVSLYPASHPAIRSALARIVEAGRTVVSAGPCTLAVLPETLLLPGQSPGKAADQAIAELADLLHRHQIAGLTISHALDAESWHRFLSLLARPPADLRLAGGVAKAWTEAGGGPIAIEEIDYAAVVQEGGGAGETVTWDRLVADWLAGGGAPGAPLASVADVAGDPARIAELAERLHERGGGAGGGEGGRSAVVRALHGLANYAARESAGSLDATMQRMAGAAMQLSPDVLLAVLTDPPPQNAAGEQPRVDLAAELQRHLTDEAIGKYVADNVVKDRGATGRLATAFTTLVPDPARQHQVLELARHEAKGSSFGQDPRFEGVWENSMRLLTSYSDKEYVSADYARELTESRTQAVAVDRVGDVQPARLRAWTATVSDAAVRALDQRLVLDLLAIEKRPEAWAGVLESAIVAVERLTSSGDIVMASDTLDAIVTASRDETHAAGAQAGLARLAAGPFTRHLAVLLRRLSDAEAEVATAMCRTIGPALVKPLADALAVEDNARALRRLRDVLISFGQAARVYANELRGSTNPAVRRAAVDLLRALGGREALPDLRSMLDDTDAQVQREALRAIVQVGTDEAFGLLDEALKSGSDRTRDAVVQALGTIRDERIAPLLVHLLGHSDFTGPLETVYVSTIEALGRVGGGDRSVAMLTTILNRGQWWAPGRTARLRLAAARALRAMMVPAADQALHGAAATGSAGVKRAARAALAEAAPRHAGARNS